MDDNMMIECVNDPEEDVDNISDEILSYFQDNPNEAISLADIRKEFDEVNKNTITGTIYRLRKRKLIQKVKRGCYRYIGGIINKGLNFAFDESADIKIIPKVNQSRNLDEIAEEKEFPRALLQKNLEMNISILKNDENKYHRNDAMKNLQWISRNNHIIDMDATYMLFNEHKKFKDEGFYLSLARIFSYMLECDKPYRAVAENPDSTACLIKHCNKSIVEIILSDDVDLSSRQSMWMSYIDIGNVNDSIRIFDHVLIDETEDTYGAMQECMMILVDRISRMDEKIRKSLFLKLYNFLSGDNEKTRTRAEWILGIIRNRHYAKFYCFLEN